MRTCVLQRDEGCWVTGSPRPITNRHICPKQKGDHLLCVIYRDFISSSLPTPAPSIFDEECGIILNPALDRLFDMYELGLWQVAQVRSSFFSLSTVQLIFDSYLGFI